jgi:site-specific recombinase XerD
MIRLMLQTGLRAGELRSFPASYVAENDSSSGIHEVRLSARDMNLKNQSEGLIYITNALMSELWKYKVYTRAQRVSPNTRELFVSRQGNPYSSSFFTTLFKKASSNLGFAVHAHLLRHTYATHTLQNMRKRTNDGAALMYVRDRLRHASVRTTEIYLHVWSDRADQTLDEYQQHLDEIFNASL